MGKRKSKEKNKKVKNGSRLKLQNGNFARVLKTLENNDTTVLVCEYRKSKKDNVCNIPFGHITEVVRY